MAWYHDHLNAYHSKITLPNYIEENLPRDNIIRIIDSTPLDKIVYMVAPFGYGKTQAVLQWLEKMIYAALFAAWTTAITGRIRFWGL